MSPLVKYILLCIQNVDICLFYNERFGPKQEPLNPLQIEYSNIPHAIVSTKSNQCVHLKSVVFKPLVAHGAQIILEKFSGKIWKYV